MEEIFKITFIQMMKYMKMKVLIRMMKDINLMIILMKNVTNNLGKVIMIVLQMKKMRFKKNSMKRILISNKSLNRISLNT